MNLLEIKEFLKNKPGYLKEGGRRLSKILKITNIELCKQAIREVQRELKFKKISKAKRLFFDIETSYNIVKSWRVGYNLTVQPDDIIHERAIISIAWKWEGEDATYCMSWNKGDDKELVKKFVELLNEADEIVGHNIERYDTTFIMTRALKHGILALPKYNQYDTLKKAKTYFNFNSNKLDYIAKFLGLEGKYKHSGMKMWDDIILYDLFGTGTQSQRNESMKEMMHYNMMDVIQTEEVFNRLRIYTDHNVHHGVILGKPKFTCPNDGSENVELIKTYVTKTGYIKRIMRCNDCNQSYILSNTEYLKFLNK